MTTGARSVVGGGKLLMNMSFPRLLLPLSALRTAFFRFLPTLIVYFAIHLIDAGSRCAGRCCWRRSSCSC